VPARELPALYMIWDGGAARPSVDVSAGYEVSAAPDAHADAIRPLIEEDGALTNAQWTSFVDRVLPGGLFVARVSDRPEPVGTVAAIHEPRGGRFYFPGGGQIGYLIVTPAHRGRGLGQALVARAVERLVAGGYRTIWLGVQASRTAAIRTYLSAGFVPFLHAPDPDSLEFRWREIFARLSRPVEPQRWRRSL
jgi:ribosomal protein S18 acetylase RimI-like enzyme